MNANDHVARVGNAVRESLERNTMQDSNLPGGVTQQDCDGGPHKKPKNEKVHDYIRDNWRGILEDHAGDLDYEEAEVLGCDDNSLEETEVLLTFRAIIPWAEIEA